MFIEEETCSDAELGHTGETLSVLAIDTGLASSGGSGGAAGLEVGIASADLSGVNIKFDGAYDDPVVIAGTPTHNGDEELAIRITRLGKSSFDMYADIPNHGYGEGAICGGNAHASEDFGWLIIDTGITGPIEAGKGTYGQCSGGSLCTPANGCSTCDHSTGFDWLTITFTDPVDNPVVQSQILSHTGGDWVKTRHRNIAATGFQVKQEEDGLDIGHNTEVYGWLAMSKGTGNLGGLVYEAIVTPNTVTHNPYDVQFSTEFTRMPSIFGNIHTFNGADPSHLRMIAQEEYTFYDGHNAWSGQGALDDNEPVEGFRSCK